MASLNTQILKGVVILLPPLPEQTGITAILDAMNAEIATLEEKLAKARNIKQGMMHELLTGSIRLL
jgi:type I restriction enzyme, S subunit